jgi:hypothetical protein
MRTKEDLKSSLKGVSTTTEIVTIEVLCDIRSNLKSMEVSINNVNSTLQKIHKELEHRLPT